MELLEKIRQREAKVGVVGLGYVGLPLMLTFGEEGFPVLGFDVDEEKVKRLHLGESYIKHIDSDRIRNLFTEKHAAAATTDFSRITECDAILICVPTPLTKHREPDLQFITSTGRQMAPFLRKNQLVVLESTTFPGTTEEVLAPLLESGSGLQAGIDLFLAYSPEREDPNNPNYTTATIPKVVGGYNPVSGKIACELYGSVIHTVVPVSNSRTAEAVKLQENIFRSINIGLVNELKILFTQMDIDIWEVIKAASTKPFGYMPFYPGPGLGGHCIPIDPFYLTWKAREFDLPTKFIELAGEINTSMPDYVVQRIILALNQHSKALKNSRVILIGLAYKKNVDDERESPSYALWDKLEKLGANVDYYDPYCNKVGRKREHPQFSGIRSRSWDEVLNGNYDAAVIATAHDAVNHDELVRHAALVIDTRGVCKPAPNVVTA